MHVQWPVVDRIYNGKLPSVSERRFKDLQESSLPKSRRNQHVHVCVRRELASKLEQLQSDIHYCYQCFEWVVGEHWNGHCQEHLSAITSKRCGSITYCHTLVRPGYCPFHLGDERLPASERWESWTRDRKLWIYLDKHISKVKHWPSPCSHPLCELSSAFLAVHGIMLSDKEVRPGRREGWTRIKAKRSFITHATDELVAQGQT